MSYLHRKDNRELGELSDNVIDSIYIYNDYKKSLYRIDGGRGAIGKYLVNRLELGMRSCLVEIIEKERRNLGHQELG